MSANLVFLVQQPGVGEGALRELTDSEIRSYSARHGHQLRQRVRQESLHPGKPRRQPGRPRGKGPRDDREAPWILVQFPSNDEARTNGSLRKSTTLHVRRRKEDPMSSILSSELDRLLPLYARVSAHSNNIFSSSFKVKRILTSDFTRFMTDEAMFHAGAAAIMFEANRLIDPDTDSSDVLRHKARALQIIGRRIGERKLADNATILAVMVMPVCEDTSCHVESYKIHWRAASALIQARLEVGSISDTPDGEYLNMFIDAAAPCYKAMTNNEMPREYKQHAPVYSMSPSSSFETWQIPLGFQSLLEQQKLGTTALAMIENVMNNHGELSTDDLHEQMWSSFPEAWSTYGLSPSTIPNEPSIEVVVLIALSIYMIRPSGPVGITGFMTRQMQNMFIQLMSICLSERSYDEETALFWAFSVLVDSLKTRFGDLSKMGLRMLDLQRSRFPCWMANHDVSCWVLGMFFCNGDFLKHHKRFVQRFADSEASIHVW